MKKLLLASLIAAGALAGAVEFRIEGEHFSNKACWKNDSFMSQLPPVGGWLIRASNFKKGDAAGNTASSTYGVPENGKYYVWVRPLDWGTGYRKTTIKINDKKIGTFGDGPVTKRESPEYKWKRALLPVDLADQFTITLTPFAEASRVDSIIFTTNKDYKPSDVAKEVEDSVEEMEFMD